MGMILRSDNIVSSSEMVKNFSNIRNRVKLGNDIVVFKNNKPDLVVIDIEHYQKLLQNVELLEDMEIARMIEEREKTDNGKRYSLDDALAILSQ